MHITWTYPASFEHLDGEIVVRFADLPEVLTGASTKEEARALAADALDEAVLAYLAAGRPVPAPRAPRRGEEAIALDPLTAGRAAVAALMAEHKVSKVALAARMKKDEKVVRRILGDTGSVTMETVVVALRALGARAALTISEA